MPYTTHPIEEFQQLVKPLVGLTVSLPWKGYGSAVYLELGVLAPLESPRQNHKKGESSIFVGWDWRIETGTSVLYGSTNSRPKIVSGINSLQDATIQSVQISGQVPELVVQFSNGHCLRSMRLETGDPEWSIRLPDRRWVCACANSLEVGKGPRPMTKEETNEEKVGIALEEQAAARWGKPIIEPKQGDCTACVKFVAIDGQADLLDYGVCLAINSPFDGRVVNRASGCPSFEAL